MKSRLVAALFALTMTAGTASAQSCGDADTPCVIDGGTYHAIAPASDPLQASGPKGVVFFLHGGGGRGKSLLNSGMARAATKRGYVYVAPDGYHLTHASSATGRLKPTTACLNAMTLRFLQTCLPMFAHGST